MKIFKARTAKNAPLHPRPKRVHRRWLLWLTLFTLLVGGGMTYILYMDTTLVDRERYMLLSIMATLFIAGISLISAAADWFIER